MEETYYSVRVCGDLYAEKCTLEAAIMLTKSAFETYFNEPTIEVTVVRSYFGNADIPEQLEVL